MSISLTISPQQYPNKKIKTQSQTLVAICPRIRILKKMHELFVETLHKKVAIFVSERNQSRKTWIDNYVKKTTPKENFLRKFCLQNPDNRTIRIYKELQSTIQNCQKPIQTRIKKPC